MTTLTRLLQSWTVALVVGLGGAALADDPPVRGKQLEYDPSTGEFVESAPPVEGTPEGDLALARQAFGREEHRRAYRRVQKWLKTYGPDHELSPEARLLRAELQIARRNYYKAHKLLQEFLGEYAGTQLGDRAADLEFVIAEVFLSGTKRKVWGMRILSSEDIGIEILDQLASDYPESAMAESAIKVKADHYFDNGDFALAELEYARLVQQFPRSRYVRYAMLRSAEAALASFPGVEFDDAALIEAEERYTQYLAQYGPSAEQEGIGLILQQIYAKRAEKEFSIGRYYERSRHAKAAIFYYRSTYENWPDTIAAAKAHERLAGLGALERPQGEPADVEEESPS
jgi:tetratricopeptide (TPR) repeat protein